MATTNFVQKAYQDLEAPDFNNTYTNSRYAPQGNQKVGLPFPMYKEFGGRLTDWRSSGLQESTWKKEFGLPTNTNFFRTSVTADALNLGNANNSVWVKDTQTLKNVANTIGCNNNEDCEVWPGTTCNFNYENWPDAFGNQSGGYCSNTYYPEMKSNQGHPSPAGTCGNFHRKLANEGGIGRACTTDADCGQGYACNNTYDFVGSNLQQSGYCAMTYACPDGSQHFLGTPWNSGIPIPPPKDQNNSGHGYDSKDVCLQNIVGKQDCVQDCNGRWFATYPGYCGVQQSLRQGVNTRTSGQRAEVQGFELPGFATTGSSNMGGVKTKAFTSWNIQSDIGGRSTIQESEDYAQSLDPIPRNLYQ